VPTYSTLLNCLFIEKMVVGKVEKEALRQLVGIRERGKLMMRVTTREV
jgi:hypothetical protein